MKTIKEETNGEQQKKEGSFGLIKKRPILISVTFLFVLHVMVLFFASRFYGMDSLAMLTKYSALTVFELAFFVSYLNYRPLMGIVSSFAALLALIVVSNFFFPLFFVIYGSPIILLYAVVILIFGIAVGLLVRKMSKINNYHVVIICLITFLFFNLTIVSLFKSGVEDCEDRINSVEVDFCYSSMAERKKDAKLCTKVQDLEDRRSCYYWVLVGYEDNPSTDKCEVIPDKDDREHCYSRVARDSLDEKICDKVKNGDSYKMCLRAVELVKCSKKDQGRGECRQAVEAKYPKAIPSANTTSTGGKIQEFVQIKRSIEIAQMKAKTCTMNEDGVLIDSKQGTGPLCKNYDFGNWPSIAQCGPNDSDIGWVVVNSGGEWNFTLECANHQECSGKENVLCNKNGCTISGKCQ